MKKLITFLLLLCLLVSPVRSTVVNKPLLGELPNWSLFPPPVALYVMNEGSGGITQDLSGNNNTGTFTTLSWTAGQSGSAVKFVDAGYISLAKPSVIDLSQFTIVGQLQVVAAHEGMTIYHEYNARMGLQIERQFDNLHFLATREYDDTSATAESSNYFLAGYSTNLLHYAAVFNDGTWTIYVNGIEDTQNGVVGIGNMVGKGADVERYDIGTTYYREVTFDGNMDTFSIYNRALGASEIEQLSRDSFPWFRPSWGFLYGGIPIVTPSGQVIFIMN